MTPGSRGKLTVVLAMLFRAMYFSIPFQETYEVKALFPAVLFIHIHTYMPVGSVNERSHFVSVQLSAL